MSDYLRFADISYAQGEYNMSLNGDLLISIRMSHGDGALTYDTQAARNYANATAAGKTVCGYHFAGGGDPTAEAALFLSAMSPLAENDVMALDWEIEHPDPVGWCVTFMTYIHDRTNVWPLIYMDIDRLNRFDWTPIFSNCGLWLAAPSFGFDEDIPMVHHTYVAQQGPIVNGVDTDAWFGTIEQFKAYGYHKESADPITTPPITPPMPTPSPTPGTNIDGVIPPASKPNPVPVDIPLPPVVVVPVGVITTKEHAWDVLVRSAKTLVAVYTAFVAAGGFNVVHLSIATEVKVTAIATAITAVWNTLLKVWGTTGKQ